MTPMHPDSLPIKLKGSVNILSLQTLSSEYNLKDLHQLTQAFLPSNTEQAEDSINCANWPIEVFNTIEIPMLAYYGDSIVTYQVHCTGPGLFQQRDSHADWVWVRWRSTSETAPEGSLNSRLVGRLNTLFKIQASNGGKSYSLAHVSMLSVIGSSTPDGPEGMVRVGIPWHNCVLPISQIEGMAHLIPIEPDQRWLINNHIDLITWNDIHDGN